MYISEDVQNGTISICKVEKQAKEDNTHSLIKREIKILLELKGIIGLILICLMIKKDSQKSYLMDDKMTIII